MQWCGNAVPTPFFPTLKHGCDLTDVIVTRRFALLVKIYNETGISSVDILAGECSLYSNYLMQSSFLFGVGTAFQPFPHLFF